MSSATTTAYTLDRNRPRRQPLAAHPQVDGILTQGYGTGAIMAPGRRPICRYRAPRVAALPAQPKPSVSSNPAYLSSGDRMAVDISTASRSPPTVILVNGDFLSTAIVRLYPEAVMQKIEIGEMCPDRPRD
jgi:ribose transport system substrate-binding protein